MNIISFIVSLLSWYALSTLSSCHDSGPFHFKDQVVKEILELDEQESIDEGKVYFEDLEANYQNLYDFILKDKCLGCHDSQSPRAEVDLSSYSTMFDYSEYYSEITVVGMPDDSSLFTEVFNKNMPPRKPLDPDEVAFIKRWILEGAVN